MKKGVFKKNDINKLCLVRFISSIGVAAFATIWAIYLDSFLNNMSYVGFLISFFGIVSILSYFFIIPLVEKTNKIKLYSVTLFLYILSYILFAILPMLWAVIILGIFISFLQSLRITCFGIIFRDKCLVKKVSKNEGFIYVIINISYLIGPLLAGFIANKYGFSFLFFFLAFLGFLAWILLGFFKIKDNNIRKKVDKNILKVVIEFFRKKDRVLSYFLGGGVSFWWIFLYTYIPIHMINNGFSLIFVGYFTSAITIPLILTEYYFGKFAGKNGFKKIIMVGYLILALAAILCFFMNNLDIILGILILASFGAAMIESNVEAYFFDTISKKQRTKYYEIYKTSIKLNNFVAMGISAILLLFLPFKFMFMFFSFAMLIFALISLRIKDIFEKRRG